MGDLLKVLVASAIALAVIGFAVFVRNDATMMVPPPEAVAEEFARELATGRYEMALPHVESTSAITLSSVRVAGENLTARSGRVDQVEGEPGAIDGAHAMASALLTTERGQVRLRFRLVRTSGVWKIVGWEQQN
jgi:hypothetical protein